MKEQDCKVQEEKRTDSKGLYASQNKDCVAGISEWCPSGKEILENRRMQCVEDIRAIEVIQSMLPSEMTHVQNKSLVRILLNLKS